MRAIVMENGLERYSSVYEAADSFIRNIALENVELEANLQYDLDLGNNDVFSDYAVEAVLEKVANMASKAKSNFVQYAKKLMNFLFGWIINFFKGGANIREVMKNNYNKAVKYLKTLNEMESKVRSLNQDNEITIRDNGKCVLVGMTMIQAMKVAIDETKAILEGVSESGTLPNGENADIGNPVEAFTGFVGLISKLYASLSQINLTRTKELEQTLRLNNWDVAKILSKGDVAAVKKVAESLDNAEKKANEKANKFKEGKEVVKDKKSGATGESWGGIGSTLLYELAGLQHFSMEAIRGAGGNRLNKNGKLQIDSVKPNGDGFSLNEAKVDARDTVAVKFKNSSEAKKILVNVTAFTALGEWSDDKLKYRVQKIISELQKEFQTYVNDYVTRKRRQFGEKYLEHVNDEFKKGVSSGIFNNEGKCDFSKHDKTVNQSDIFGEAKPKEEPKSGEPKGKGEANNTSTGAASTTTGGTPKPEGENNTNNNANNSNGNNNNNNSQNGGGKAEGETPKAEDTKTGKAKDSETGENNGKIKITEEQFKQMVDKYQLEEKYKVVEKYREQYKKKLEDTAKYMAEPQSASFKPNQAFDELRSQLTIFIDFSKGNTWDLDKYVKVAEKMRRDMDKSLNNIDVEGSDEKAVQGIMSMILTLGNNFASLQSNVNAIVRNLKGCMDNVFTDTMKLGSVATKVGSNL